MLYDVGDDEGVPYRVMEHLEGETLEARLRKGPLPLNQVLDLGAQVADALSAAHRHGIVHRDLKPANVLLTKAGAKLLNFGLAKLRPQEGVRLVRDSSATVTQARDVTAAGTLMGTLPYMAPEQVEGREADARTDLWALGCLLYEMVTGQRAFEGATTGSLVGAILAKEPAPLAARQPLTPPALKRLVKRCLAKDPDQRWDSAHDVADELRWISTPGGQIAASASGAASVGVGRGWSRRRAWVFGAALAVLGIVAGSAVTWLWRPPSSAPDREVRHVLLDLRPADGLRGIPRDRPSRTELALTPDGRRLVFTGGDGNRSQLYVRDFRDAEAKPIPNTEDGSPVSLAGRSCRRVLRGCRRPEADDAGRRRSAHRDLQGVPSVSGELGRRRDHRVCQRRTSGLWRVSSDGGTPEAVTTPAAGEYSHRLPHVLPGSRAVLFTIVESPWNWEAARVVVHRFGDEGMAGPPPRGRPMPATCPRDT